MPFAQRELVMAGHAVLFCLLCMFSFPAFADLVFWGDRFKPTTLHAGPLTCEQTMGYGDGNLICRLGDTPLFDVRAFADHLAVSDNGQYIVGLSNRGMVPLYWLRNSSGKQIRLEPSGDPLCRPAASFCGNAFYRDDIRFCRMSVTNVREWFDGKHPDVTFRFNGDKLTKVSVRGCDGREVEFRAAE